MVTYGSVRRMYARFDSFQLDLSSNELFHSGVRVPIQEQPLQILRLLLEAEGRVVTREQLRSALWPKDTFVDFEHGVNTAVKKLRRALQDSAESPRFVETLPKVGYRFMVPVEWAADGIGSNPQPQVVPISAPGPIAVPSRAPSEVALKAGWRWRPAYLGIGLLLLAMVAGFLLRPRRQLQPGKLTVVPFTTFPGFEMRPAFRRTETRSFFPGLVMERSINSIFTSSRSGRSTWCSLPIIPPSFLYPPGRPTAG